MGKIKLEFLSESKSTLSEFLLSKHFGDRQIFSEIKEENVLINGSLAKDRNVMLNPGDKVVVYLNEEENSLFENDGPLDIVYEDEYILVVNKPYDLDVEPSRYSATNNLASLVVHYFKIKSINSKIHIVNRLDKLTSGLVIIAKNRYIKNLFKYIDIEKLKKKRLLVFQLVFIFLNYLDLGGTVREYSSAFYLRLFIEYHV